MKRFPMNKLAVAILVSLPLLTACGGSTSSNSAEQVLAAETTDVMVERGPVLHASVTDASGKMALELGNGMYRFSGEVRYPVQSRGGVIDVDRNGLVNAGDVATDGLSLSTDSGQVMTLATTMARTQTLRTLLSEMDPELTEDFIYQHTPSSDRKMAALSDEVYKYCIENEISDPSQLTAEELASLQQALLNRIESYEGTDTSVADLEADVVAELNVSTLNEAAASRLAGGGVDALIATFPTYDLSAEQEYTLAYMWNEEKMAKDLYLALYDLYGQNQMLNIAEKAETQHQASVEALIAKYDIDISNLGDETLSYSAEALAALPAGTYGVAAVQDLYDALYAEGVVSPQAALEVGCKVEVTDINDLNRDIEVAGEAQDLVAVFENLRAGSYQHYWAFDKGLKALGVAEGCCRLGEDFCHLEYPQNASQGGMGGH